jgi:hypothetical protein
VKSSGDDFVAMGTGHGLDDFGDQRGGGAGAIGKPDDALGVELRKTRVLVDYVKVWGFLQGEPDG